MRLACAWGLVAVADDHGEALTTACTEQPFSGLFRLLESRRIGGRLGVARTHFGAAYSTFVIPIRVLPDPKAASQVASYRC